MKTQKFFGLTIHWTGNEGNIDRWLLQTILQGMFNLELKGEELSEHINGMGIKTLDILRLKEFSECENKEEWWKESFGITSINRK